MTTLHDLQGDMFDCRLGSRSKGCPRQQLPGAVSLLGVETKGARRVLAKESGQKLKKANNNKNTLQGRDKTQGGAKYRRFMVTVTAQISN